MENNFNLKKYLTENKLTEKVFEETSLNEEALDFTSEEIEMLKDGLSAILNYQEGVAPDEYIDAVRALEAKLG
ncbi:hypothetical protein N9795_00935 [Candidatus Pelagibacter sp.]|nr:hypothetical protein [Candidatus Pelagibacter sp.]